MLAVGGGRRERQLEGDDVGIGALIVDINVVLSLKQGCHI
jgi:hypothetical protein